MWWGLHENVGEPWVVSVGESRTATSNERVSEVRIQKLIPFSAVSSDKWWKYGWVDFSTALEI